MSTQLNNVQEAMELIISLLLDDDAKKGEKLSKTKCKSIQAHVDDDTVGDGGNKVGK